MVSNYSERFLDNLLISVQICEWRNVCLFGRPPLLCNGPYLFSWRDTSTRDLSDMNEHCETETKVFINHFSLYFGASTFLYCYGSFAFLFLVFLCIMVQALVLPAGSDPLTLGTHTALTQKKKQRYKENLYLNKRYTRDKENYFTCSKKSVHVCPESIIRTTNDCNTLERIFKNLVALCFVVTISVKFNAKLRHEYDFGWSLSQALSLRAWERLRLKIPMTSAVMSYLVNTCNIQTQNWILISILLDQDVVQIPNDIILHLLVLDLIQEVHLVVRDEKKMRFKFEHKKAQIWRPYYIKAYFISKQTSG